MSTTDMRETGIAELGEELARLRLCGDKAVETMRRSLERHGQLTPLFTYRSGARLEVLDGFKRLRAARTLAWSTLRTSVADLGPVEAKVALTELHTQRTLTELEQGWVVRSLYREDGLSQGAIAARLSRHKSWVNRRLMLVERVEDEVQAFVRLGLLAPRAAVILSALPRGNQVAAGRLVIQRGMTVRQVEVLVAELSDLADDAVRARRIAEWTERTVEAGPAPRPTRAARSEADWIAADVAAVARVGARLDARLRATPLGALGPAAEVIVSGLTMLAPVVCALGRTVATITGQPSEAS